MIDLILWYMVSTLFFFEWKIGFLERFIANWLSMNNDVAYVWGIPKSCKTIPNQTISHVASHADMYSDSTEEVATVACFLKLKYTAADPMFIK